MRRANFDSWTLVGRARIEGAGHLVMACERRLSIPASAPS